MGRVMGRNGGRDFERPGERRMVHDVGGRLDPLAGVVDAAIGADGADKSFGRHREVLGAFEKRFEGEADGASPFFKKARSAGMAVDGGLIDDAIVLSDVF